MCGRDCRTNAIYATETVKALNAEEFMKSKWEEHFLRQSIEEVTTAKKASLNSNVVLLVSKLTNVVVLYAGSIDHFENKITTGTLIAFLLISNRVLASISILANLTHPVLSVTAALSRIGEVFELDEAQGWGGNEDAYAGPNQIQSIGLQNATFSYRTNNAPVLRNLDFEASRNSITAIVGPSGSGKSTLIKVLIGFLEPSEGSVVVDGSPVSVVASAKFRRKFGVVPQQCTLFSGTIRENITLGFDDFDESDFQECLRLSGARDFVEKLPEKEYTKLYGSNITLSGGERQRISIARALIRRPEVLILDEATSALDYESEIIVSKNLSEIAAGRITIIISHRLSAIRGAGNIYVMRNGGILAQGSNSQLQSSCDWYLDLCESQRTI